MLKIEDLYAGDGSDRHRAERRRFRLFVDIGMHDSGLVHVSHIADRFVRDPHEVVAVGDIVKTWVLLVDKERRRVSLSMIPPGTDAQRRGPRSEKPAEGVPARLPPPRPAPSSGKDAPIKSDPKARGKGRGKDRDKDKGKDRGERVDRRRRGARPRGGPPYGKPRSSSGGYDRPPPPKPRPKVFVPITDEMKAGKAPMRTFGDLAVLRPCSAPGGKGPEIRWRPEGEGPAETGWRRPAVSASAGHWRYASATHQAASGDQRDTGGASATQRGASGNQRAARATERAPRGDRSAARSGRGDGAAHVGWVDRSEPHQNAVELCKVGLAALDPPYHHRRPQRGQFRFPRLQPDADLSQ